MFETLSYLQLQQYWWAIAALLGGLLVFLLFVQGGQTLVRSVAKTEDERNLVINSLGRKWEFTFTTLVTFGGAMFAAFPLFYSTSFGGAYWLWMMILFCFILQAVSYEFRRKPGNLLGTKTYDIFLVINGSFGAMLLGTAVGSFFSGSEFSVSAYNLSKWENSSRGFESMLNFDNLALGHVVFFLARILGAMYFINNIEDDNILKRSVKQVKFNTVFFLGFFLFYVIHLMMRDGYAYNPQTHIVSMEPHKYLNNFMEMPVVLAIFVVGALSVLSGIFITAFRKSRKAIWCTGAGTVLTVFALLLNAGYNNTCFYPSSYDWQSSLTIENASSSRYTLTAMSYVSLLIPFVLAYIIIAWRAMDKKKITTEDLNKEDHAY